jgi:predicted permease
MRRRSAVRHLKTLVWRAPVEEEVDAELAFHLEMTTRELMEKGMPEDQARAEAARRFGDINAVHNECRQFGHERDRNASRAELRTELRQDSSFAVRQLARARGFTLISTLTLALGIGATAAVFSVLYAVVLRPLPVDHPELVVQLWASVTGTQTAPAPAEFVAMRENTKVFEHVAAGVLQAGFTLNEGDAPEMVGGDQVSADYFSVFGVKPALGRTFTTDDDLPGQSRVVVLSHRAWITRFKEDSRILGRRIKINGEPHTVIGVMPASFAFTPGGPELWVPLALSAEQKTRYAERYLRVFARLKPGVSIEQARSAATAAERAFIATVPDRRAPVTDFAVAVNRFVDDLVGDYRGRLWVLLGAVGFVLLIACTNVANLLLARGSARARELAIRAALGAGRGRLVRQLLTESLVLATTGAILGIGVSYALLRSVLMLSPGDVPRLTEARIDWHVLAFTLALGVVCSLLVGLIPALRAAGPSLQGTLREGGRGATGPGRERLRGFLVGAEVALAMTLLTGAGLLIRSALLVQRVDPGFDPRGVLAARVMLPAARYSDPATIALTFTRMRDEAARIPGVESSALVSVVPLSGSTMNASVFTDGPSSELVTPLQSSLRLASAGYFATMGIPIRAGRDIAEADREGAPLVIVVNEALANLLWPGVLARDVIGRRMASMSRRSSPRWMQVIGVVGDLHDTGLDRPATAEFYVPYGQTPAMLWPLIQRSLVVVVRGANESVAAESFVPPLRRAIAQVDPSLPLADSRSMTGYLRSSVQTARFNTLMLSTLGAIALLLAMVGVYGVVAYFVTQRTQEIGIRIALGATPRRIWRLVARRGLTPIGAGVVAGLGLSLFTARVLEGQLFGVTPSDPLTLGAVGLVLLGVSVVATYAPARRAMRVPPVVALNEG